MCFSRLFIYCQLRFKMSYKELNLWNVKYEVLINRFIVKFFVFYDVIFNWFIKSVCRWLMYLILF